MASTSTGAAASAGSSQNTALERELATYKERYQTAEAIQVTLSKDLAQLQDMYDKSKDNIKKLVQDKMSQEERIQVLVRYPDINHFFIKFALIY